MCDCFSLRTSVHQLAEVFAIPGAGRVDAVSAVDVIHGQSANVVRLSSSGERILSPLKWGLAPVWPIGCDLAARKYTANAETLFRTPAYRVNIRQFRCLIPADSFVQASQSNGHSRPLLVTTTVARPFAFAGMWDLWIYGDRIHESFTIITVKSDSPLHDRVPAILPKQSFAAWLSPNSNPEELVTSLQASPTDTLQYYSLTRPINAPETEAPSELQPVAA